MSKQVSQVDSHEAMLTVRRTAFGQEVSDLEAIPVRPFATVPAHVRVSKGRTINMGNYESARVDVSIDMPCYREEVLDVYNKLTAEADKLMEREVTAILSGSSLAADSSIEEIL